MWVNITADDGVEEQRESKGHPNAEPIYDRFQFDNVCHRYENRTDNRFVQPLPMQSLDLTRYTHSLSLFHFSPFPTQSFTVLSKFRPPYWLGIVSSHLYFFLVFPSTSAHAFRREGRMLLPLSTTCEDFLNSHVGPIRSHRRSHGYEWPCG